MIPAVHQVEVLRERRRNDRRKTKTIASPEKRRTNYYVAADRVGNNIDKWA